MDKKSSTDCKHHRKILRKFDSLVVKCQSCTRKRQYRSCNIRLDSSHSTDKSFDKQRLDSHTQICSWYRTCTGRGSQPRCRRNIEHIRTLTCSSYLLNLNQKVVDLRTGLSIYDGQLQAKNCKWHPHGLS